MPRKPSGDAPRDLPYDREQFLSEAYMDEETYDTLVGVLRSKRTSSCKALPAWEKLSLQSSFGLFDDGQQKIAIA